MAGPTEKGFNSWVPPDDIDDVFFKYKCNITDCSKALNISRNCLYEHLKSNPELKSKFDKVEGSLEREWVDVAEKNVWYALALAKERPGHALKAAMYVLDKRGHKRGWGAELAATANQEKILDDFAEFIAMKRQELQSSDLSISETISNADSRS